MHDIAGQMSDWVREGHEVALARVLSMDGFGGRRAGEAWAMARHGDVVGSLLMGAADDELREAANELLVGRRGAQVITVPIGDVDAVAAGLACGGVAHVLIQKASMLPASFWSATAAREPISVATVTTGAGAGSSMVFRETGREVSGDGSLGEPAADAAALLVASDQLTRGKNLSAVVDIAGEAVRQVLVDAVIAESHMVVIGAVELAQAIARQGALLGWTTTTVDDKARGGVEQGEALASGLGPVDGLVVLSHDIAASCRALDAALRGRCGYVGALGSRNTQAVRSTYLRETLGAAETDLSRIHGPVGLDIGSRTPEETALAIFAEVLAHRAGRSARSLRGQSGPING